MYKVVLIDDEPLILVSLERRIDWAAHGFTVEGKARGGEEGLRQIHDLQPDLVFTDIRMPEPARRYSNPEDHRAAGLCRPQNCRIKQKNPGGCRGSFALSCICWQRHHATPRIFLVLFRTSAGSSPEPFTLPAISCASTSAGFGSGGFAATPWMVQ